MPSFDPITMLGRLLSDPTTHPLSDDGLVAGIGKLDHQQVERQAKGLIGKRWHEVRLLAPRTVQSLGCDGYRRFASFARSHWPGSARRHPIDALAFLRCLQSEELPINECELRMLRVMAGETRFAIGWDRATAARHLCWRGSSGVVRQRWLCWRLWYPRPASGGVSHVSLPDPRGSRTTSV